MIQTVPKSITLEEFLKQPETKPACEYYEGTIHQKTMPQGEHSTIQGELIIGLNSVLKPPKIARAYPELRCSFLDRSIVPDISVFQWDRIPRDSTGRIANSFPLAPDWIIEILSPDQSSTKVIKKILRCLEDETQMGWLIDPAEQTILVYKKGEQPEIFEMDDNLIVVPAFAQNVQLTGNDVFGWLWD